MLLAVEGGGFFSSSALGYSKGLTLLLFGKKTEKTPMRVTPWNHYQLVDQESNRDRHLASNKNRLIRGCASFLCFGRAAAGLETPSPLKVGPTHHHHQSPPNSEKVKEKLNLGDDDNVNESNECSLRSNLKRPGKRNEMNEMDHTERRVQWTDVSGGELFMIREFEPSEHSGSDDEYENGNERSCSCRLM